MNNFQLGKPCPLNELTHFSTQNLKFILLKQIQLSAFSDPAQTTSRIKVFLYFSRIEKEMQNSFLSSNFSRKCDGQLSFWLNDYTCCSNDRFGRYPFGHGPQLPVYLPSSSSSSVTCCACCVSANANLSVYKVPVTPVYLCGLRQSTLIQYRPCKRVIFNGLDRVVSRNPGWNVDKWSNFEKDCNSREKSVCRSRKGWGNGGYTVVSRLPGRDVDKRSNFEKDCVFREKSVFRSRKDRGKGGYRCMVYEESGEEYGFEDSIDDEADVMLSLLTEEVSEECLDVRRRDGRQQKKIVVEESWNGGNLCADCGSKKKVGSGILRNRLKFEYEPVVDKGRDEVGRIRERTEEEEELSFRRGHRRVSARREHNDELLRGRPRKHERDELLRESRKKEREDTLIENHTASARKEHKENLSRREEHKQKLRKDGSGCTSYYSLSSTGEFESDSELQERGKFGERLPSKYDRDSGMIEKVEFDGKTGRQGGYQEEESVLKKGKRIEGEELIWHRESENKLTNVSTKETRFREGFHGHDDVSKKASYKKYEGQEEKATSVVKSNRARREQRLTNDEVEQKTETIKNFKQFKEHSEGYHANLASSSGSQTQLSQREDISSTGSSSLKKIRKKHDSKAGLIIREHEYEKSGTHAQLEKHQKLDIRKTSSSEIISETIHKDQEDDSNTVLSSGHDAKEEHYHHGQFSTQIDSRKASKQSTEEEDIQRATISQRQKQEESSSLVYGSYHESIKNTQTNVVVGKPDSKTTQEKRTNILLGNNRASARNDADQGISKYDTLMTPPSSQPVARGSLHTGSSSGLMIEEVGHDSSHEDPDVLTSAGLLQKSSSYHVGEFMEKVRHDMSSSEIQTEKMTHETKLEHDFKNNEQQTVTEVASGGSQLKEQSRGPSVEMWDVDELSNQENPEAAVLETNSASSVITKRTGRSLWNVISDIVRFPWALRSTDQSHMSKSGGKNSPNQSTSSTSWFSGNEPDENIQGGKKRRKESVSQESTSVQIPKEQQERIQSQGVSSSSSSSKDQNQPVEEKSLPYAEVLSWNTSPGSNFPSSGEGTSHQQSKGVISGASMEAGSAQLPAIRLRRSPYIVGESPTSKKVDVSGEGEIVQTKLPVPTDASEMSQLEGEYGEQKSRKLLRTNQVEKDRFEEWEEAYRIEAEQRKMDEMFMREALLEARKAADSWEVPVGAVLVHDGKIIARGHNLVEELRDSTAHAEMICIREASNILHTWRLSGTTLYVTLEPCAMCAGAILQARIDVVVWGAPNKLLGADGSWIRLFPTGEGDSSMNPSDKADAPVHPFHPNIQIRRNVLASECADSMQQFFQLRRKKQKKQQRPISPPSCLPVVNHPSKFLTKMHDAFHMMFCL